ncbi:synaptopodin 2-like protein [Denticeps clupeoides]|uniref:Synaptopodin 2-like protein n=1 Tax=Denticeps clupeoides TaxID=299321 RepID=A0AAY4C0J9_9TELE|nr:synaptopodin 2-like protein [Denticeps clupeoides]
MVVEEVMITLAGGAPWGFRLQGGVEHHKPLQVAKVRKRSKACRAGLREADELVSINDRPCGGLSHAQAMNLIDCSSGTLHIRVKRAPAGFQSVVLLPRAPSPRIDKEYRAALRAMSPSSSRPQQQAVRQVHRSSVISPTGRSGLTSPLGSEAYYGETDSDADVAAQERHRRQKRRSPSSSPGKAGRVSPEGGETSEMSGYDSAPDPLGGPDILPGVARREVIYQPPPPRAWSSQTSTETSSMSADDQREMVAEEDSGFQDLHMVPPLVSPVRAKEALMLGSRGQLVPMVGPVDMPVDEELTVTYMDKAKQAKLNRGESLQDKQVKEARSKCRTIASLLTDAPNPHSKGVLMFKKRRQRSKRYTLTSFGSVDEDLRQDSQEEDGVFPGSESEFDEDGFSAAPDPTWDSDYLELLEKRAASVVGRPMDGTDDSSSPGLSNTSGKGAQLFEQQRKRAAEHAKKMQAQTQSQLQEQIHTLSMAPTTQAFPVQTPPQAAPHVLAAPEPPPAAPKPLLHQNEVSPTRQKSSAPLTLDPAASHGTVASGDLGIIHGSATSLTQAVVKGPLHDSPASPIVSTLPAPASPEVSSSVLNRTARPFAPGFISHRASTAPVVFRPTGVKKSPRPVSVALVAPPFCTPEDRDLNAVSISHGMSAITGPASLIPPVPVSHIHAPLPPVVLSPAGESVPVPAPMPPLITPTVENLPAASQSVYAPDVVKPMAPALSAVPARTRVPSSGPMTPTSPMSVHQTPKDRDSAPSGRTGILQEARRQSSGRRMFTMPDEKKNSPNPFLLSMVQNLDDRQRNRMQEADEYEPVDEDEAGTQGKIPPPVAPKPRIIPEVTQIPHAEGKGAELFARRQSRMDLYVVDTPPSIPHQQQLQIQQSFTGHERDISPTQSLPGQWKYSPNVRAPPPIGYNPLLAPTRPMGPQRDEARPLASQRGGRAGQKEGIKAIDFIRRQPYQLNSAMFGGASSQTQPSYQREGHTLTPPKQIPVKAARVYEIKRFSTPTPMSAPTLTPTVIAPRSATTLGERISRSDMTSPPPAPPSQTPAAPSSVYAPTHGLPQLPKFSAPPMPSAHPLPFTPAASMSGLPYASSLQAAKQFKSAPELSALTPLRASAVQVPKPRFVATRVGIQPHVWRPGAFHL